ncbi:hypothetical protein [uncultured Martelella sp.]|uniref:hypothetical protein n=1 Tax=uncultured Martelella sp. TaxID=392331 RepID=UPI0029C805E0|nr:hypothetical protein [uncultured Martelella sp.]
MTNTRPSAQDRLESYRALIAAAVRIRDVFADADGMHLEVDGMDPGEPERICTLPHACPTANRELILHHIDISADLIAMLEATGKALRAERAEVQRLRQAIENKGGRPAKDYAAECAMKCAETAFQHFMAERHDLKLPTDKDKTATRVKFVLALNSRKDLNENAPAASRWRAMVQDFEQWRRRT